MHKQKARDLGLGMFPATDGFAAGDFKVSIDTVTSVSRRNEFIELGIGRKVLKDDLKGMPDGVDEERGTRFSGIIFDNPGYKEPLLILPSNLTYNRKHYQMH